ncbi:MAG: SulP family inorganic anion transporter [Desulfococcaceae bacterium]
MTPSAPKSTRTFPSVLARRLLPFLAWFPLVNRATLRADFFAGLTGAFIVLPQGVAFAMIAGLPPEFGIYTAIVTPVVAALFGSSRHLVSGPTTAISIIVFSTLSPFAEPGTAAYIQLALTLTFLAGLFQAAAGLARLGTLINFVSHSVVVGFTAGAAILIAAGQLKHALGMDIPRGISFISTMHILLRDLELVNPREAAVAIGTLAAAAALKTWRPQWPGLLAAMIIGGFLGQALGGEAAGIRLLGELPARLPPLSRPDLSADAIRLLAPGALAVALLGLIEALSIARAIAVQSNQRINGNQEFVGQGLSNMIGSFFSAYAGSGSFTRSGVNYQAGAQTPLSSVFAAAILALILLLVAPLTAYLPLSAMGGVILVVAFKLIDVRHIREIVKTSGSETAVLAVTFLGTLFFELEFAIYAGVLLSLALYLARTSHPHITVLAPDPDDPRRRLTDLEEKPLVECPQLRIIRIDGSLFFGAVNHVAEALERIDRHVLIVGVGINFIDVSGVLMLTHEVERGRKQGRNIYLCRLHHDVNDVLQHGGHLDLIGKERVFSTDANAIGAIFERLDRGICGRCEARIFEECEGVEYVGDREAS